ncbi:hypothetical protein GE09DRAFT_1060613 [Coniochaeta sp. 2T2.1]|nr:hypothetical protein GE09DRAFT_1060613 [Coniochaeta sp. 2T2.1]
MLFDTHVRSRRMYHCIWNADRNFSTVVDFQDRHDADESAELAYYDLAVWIANNPEAHDFFRTFPNDEKVISTEDGMLLTVDEYGYTLETLTCARRWEKDENGKPKEPGVLLFSTVGLFHHGDWTYCDGQVWPRRLPPGVDNLNGRPIRMATAEDAELLEKVNFAKDRIKEIKDAHLTMDVTGLYEDHVDPVRSFREAHHLPPSAVAEKLGKVIADLWTSKETILNLLGERYLNMRFMQPLDYDALGRATDEWNERMKLYGRLADKIEIEHDRLPEILRRHQGHQFSIQAYVTKVYRAKADMSGALYDLYPEGDPRIHRPAQERREIEYNAGIGPVPYLVEADTIRTLTELIDKFQALCDQLLAIIGEPDLEKGGQFAPVGSEKVKALEEEAHKADAVRTELRRMVGDIEAERRKREEDARTISGMKFYSASGRMTGGGGGWFAGAGGWHPYGGVPGNVPQMPQMPPMPQQMPQMAPMQPPQVPPMPPMSPRPTATATAAPAAPAAATTTTRTTTTTPTTTATATTTTTRKSKGMAAIRTPAAVSPADRRRGTAAVSGHVPGPGGPGGGVVKGLVKRYGF